MQYAARSAQAGAQGGSPPTFMTPSSLAGAGAPFFSSSLPPSPSGCAAASSSPVSSSAAFSSPAGCRGRWYRLWQARSGDWHETAGWAGAAHVACHAAQDSTAAWRMLACTVVVGAARQDARTASTGGCVIKTHPLSAPPPEPTPPSSWSRPARCAPCYEKQTVQR